MVKQEWGYSECYFSCYKNNARGVAILFNNNFDFKVLKHKHDKGGNYVVLKVLIDDLTYAIASVYAPNNDSSAFFDHIIDIIKDFNSDEISLCGDWNLVQNQFLDTFNYKNINNPKARDKVLELMDTFDLKDPWRERNYDTKRYTWRQPTPLKQARLDFFLISHDMMPSVQNCDIKPTIESDHSVIELSLMSAKISRGKGYWKFNNSLLYDKEYVDLVKDTIKSTLDQYRINNNTFSIDDQLLWETLLLMIRGKTIYYSSTKKKKKLAQEKSHQNKLIELEKALDETDENIEKEEILKEINEVKNNLDEIYNEKVQGMLIRSKAKLDG